MALQKVFNMNLDIGASTHATEYPSREVDGAWMPQLTFEIYLDDSRYTVPTLKLVAATDEIDALRIAELLMDESSHHVGAEVCQGGRRIAGFGSYAVSRTSAD